MYNRETTEATKILIAQNTNIYGQCLINKNIFHKNKNIKTSIKEIT